MLCELSDVQAGFKKFEDIIRGTPVYHRSDDRIPAHSIIAPSAPLLLRQLRHNLNEKGDGVADRTSGPWKSRTGVNNVQT